MSDTPVTLALNNSAAWPGGVPVNDRLGSFPELVRWARRSGLVSASLASRLQGWGQRHPWEGAAALAQVRELRAVLHPILVALARGRTPSPTLLRPFNAALRGALEGLSVTRQARRLGWKHDELVGTATLVHRLAWSAARLLTSSLLDRMGLCANPECGWLFLDSSKNRSRRWCSMQDCGGRAKARSYYARRRSRAI